jgi:phosphatidylglycerol:prolipoprotein diacylglycerol transferase
MPYATIPLALLVPVLAGITVFPDPVAVQLGPIPLYWYGVCYAVGLAATYVVITREARRRGLDARLVDNGIIIVAIAALIGGRLYHVIDQWERYQDDLVTIILPPYTGLGVYGGIALGIVVAWIILRRWNQSFWKWADVIAPGLFVMQAIGRWGNFFNQELYGPPTDLPWGITIDCAHRVVEYPCTAYPVTTTFFHPLFLYESISGFVGAVTLLYIARHWGARMRPGDLFLIWVIWYAAVRLALETLRIGNWEVLGVPTATIVSTAAIVGAVIVLAWRHRPSAADGDRWGDPPVPEEELYEADDEIVEDEPDAADAEPAVEPDADDQPGPDAGGRDEPPGDGRDEPPGDGRDDAGRPAGA